MKAIHYQIAAGAPTNQLFKDARCYLLGFYVSGDGTNDPTIIGYDNGAGAASGDVVVLPATYDASLEGLNGISFPKPGVLCEEGFTASVTLGAGTVEVMALVI